jgi:hypothetical protein
MNGENKALGTDDLDAARRAEGEAAVAYEMALEMRQTVDNTDLLAVAAWHADVAACATAWVHAQAVRRRLEGPSWDVLLRDPRQQFDPAGEVMRSIVDYQNATKGTADAADYTR